MNPKVLLGCPTSDFRENCFEPWAKVAQKLTYPNYEILMVDNSKQKDFYNMIKSRGINVIKDRWQVKARDRIVSSRNIIRQYALDNGFEYLFSLEQDVIPPVDVIGRLLAHNKKAISGIYLAPIDVNGTIRKLPLMFMPLDEANHQMRYLTLPELDPPRLLQVRASGMGCLLIHREVLEKVKFKWVPGNPSFDDTWFAQDVLDNGFEMWGDTSIQCEHIYTTWDGIKK